MKAKEDTVNPLRWFSSDEAETTMTSWGSLTWMVNDDLINGAELTMGIVTIDKGRSNPPHVHPNCEEIVYVLAGKCVQHVGGESSELTAGQGMVVPSNVRHHAVNTGEETLIVLVCYSSPFRETIFFDDSETGY